jgi:hypothetical protein
MSQLDPLAAARHVLEAHAKATPTPWRSDWIGTNHFEIVSISSESKDYFLMGPDYGFSRGEDLDYIVAAANLAPVLAEALLQEADLPELTLEEKAAADSLPPDFAAGLCAGKRWIKGEWWVREEQALAECYEKCATADRLARADCGAEALLARQEAEKPPDIPKARLKELAAKHHPPAEWYGQKESVELLESVVQPALAGLRQEGLLDTANVWLDEAVGDYCREEPDDSTSIQFEKLERRCESAAKLVSSLRARIASLEAGLKEANEECNLCCAELHSPISVQRRRSLLGEDQP